MEAAEIVTPFSNENCGNRDDSSGVNGGNRDIPSGFNRDIHSAVNGGNRDTPSGGFGGNRDSPNKSRPIDPLKTRVRKQSSSLKARFRCPIVLQMP